MRRKVAALLALILIDTASAQTPSRRILVFSRTTGFRHASIADGIAAIQRLGRENGFGVDATEDPEAFEDTRLAAYAAVVFLSTTGDVLNEAQQAAFERYVRGGGGFAGIHSASDTEYDWAWYGGLLGAYISNHSTIQPATIRVPDRVHASTRSLPSRWDRTDEWYNFRSNPRGRAHVLLILEESSYSGGQMGADHPIAWCQFYDGGRSWYTALGHTEGTYGEPLFLRHLLGGIRFAAGFTEDDCPRPRALSPRS